MFHHVVLLEFSKPNDPAQIAFMQEQCDFMKAEITQLLEIGLHENVSDRGQQYTHAIITRFDSSHDHDLYQAHPAHVLVKQRIKNTINSLLVFDYEVE
jgi:hypothetical protein